MVGNGRNDVLLLGVGIAPAIGDFFIYVEKWQKGSSDGNTIRQSARFRKGLF